MQTVIALASSFCTTLLTGIITLCVHSRQLITSSKNDQPLSSSYQMANKVAVSAARAAAANYLQLKSGIEFKVANNVYCSLSRARPAIREETREGRVEQEWVNIHSTTA